MTHSPYHSDTPVADARHRVRPVAAWFTLFGLLSNVLLPAAFSVAVGILHPDRAALGSSLCSATTSSNNPDKGKSALVVQHCAFCATPAAWLLRPQANLGFACVLGDTAYPPHGTTSLVVRFRHGPAQARAPPRIA